MGVRPQVFQPAPTQFFSGNGVATEMLHIELIPAELRPALEAPKTLWLVQQL